MKLFGYTEENRTAGATMPDQLAEVTLLASPNELRKMAIFFEAVASEMEARGKQWEHEHLSDHYIEFRESPHFIIFNPDSRI